MPVTSQMTTFVDLEGTPSFVSYGGGPGASANTDIIIEGAQSGGRRADNATGTGFGVTRAAVDMSAAGVHVKAWTFVTQWPLVTNLWLRISSGADDDHLLPPGDIPPLGGFIPMWVDVSRTPEVGGTANEASISEVGLVVDIGDVGGNAANLILDEVLYGSSGYRWDGASGSLADFRSFESANNEGVFITSNGIDFCYARLEIGSATATTFTDSGFTIAFPNQTLVAETFMGVTVDLQNAGTAVTFTNALIQSSNVAGATRRPDLLVTGTAGTLDFDSTNLLGLRLAQFTAGVLFDGGTLDAVSLTQGGAEINNSVLRPRTASGVALCSDPTFGASGIHDSSVVQASLGHAFEIASPGAVSLVNLRYTGFGGATGSNPTPASGANDAVFYNNSGGLVTLNVTGGDTPSVRNGAGATTVVNASALVTLTGLVVNSEVRAYLGTDPATVTEIDGVEDSGTSFSFSQSAAGQAGYIVIHALDHLNQSINLVYASTDQTIPIQQQVDRQYENPI